MSIIVGCDLGTTNSVVAYKNNNSISYITDDSGNPLIPSVCFINGNDICVGRDAVDDEENKPERTYRSTKRHMGQHKDLGFNITAETVATHILKYLKKISISLLNEEISGMVITVPAYFNQNQRHETKLAAERAGIKVYRIINEPTAAALAYGETSKISELVLIYDLGGGTFDVTLLELTDDNVYQVLSTSGSTTLGGDDFDNIIVDYIKQTLPGDLTPFSDFNVRLKKIAEEVKIKLNYKTKVTKTIKYSGTINNKIYHHTFTIEAEVYQQLISALLLQTKKHVLAALNDGDKKISQLNKIILVGGSTKSKYVREYVKSEFNTHVHHEIDPDLTVAAGAATLAKSLMNKDINDAVLIDVTPLSLGIETKGGILDKIIHRNTTIPHTAVKDYITSFDNQTSVNIKVYQGERPLSKDNEPLGEFVLSGFPPRPKGQTIISVRFEIDVSGIIHVLAYDKISGENMHVSLQPLSSEKINHLISDLENIDTNDEEIVKSIILEDLQKQARAKILQLTLRGENKQELNEVFESTKHNIEKLSIFLQSLQQ